MKDDSHFEVVESGRYIILLVNKALSVVWDHHLGISVVLKQTYQVSGVSALLLRLVCDLLFGRSSASQAGACCLCPMSWGRWAIMSSSLLPTQIRPWTEG